MEAVFRGLAIYLTLLIVFRLAGRRTLAQLTNFDLILLLIISETTQNALVGQDFSVTKAVLLVVTLVGADILLSLVKEHVPAIERWIDSLPLIIVEDGKPLTDRMRKARVDRDDVLASARATQGLEEMAQVKAAVLERNGQISIIPKKDGES